MRRAERVPEETVAVSIGLDRTSVPMMEDRPADAPPKPERKRLRPRQRRAPAPFDVNWRMGYVGTVSFVDALGESLRTVRYAAAACDDPRELVVQMTADVRSALKRQPDLKVGIVQDGAHEMWNRTREGLQTLRGEGLLTRWEEGIDRYHLLERIAAAMAIVEPDAEARKRKLDEWREGFDIQDSTIDRVEYFLRSRYSLAPEDKREALWDHLRFIGNNKDRMRYVTLRLAELPVGSGVTESTCKTVFGQRTKRSGQRWRVLSVATTFEGTRIKKTEGWRLRTARRRGRPRARWRRRRRDKRAVRGGGGKRNAGWRAPERGRSGRRTMAARSARDVRAGARARERRGWRR